jgi:hypothetical protein
MHHRYKQTAIAKQYRPTWNWVPGDPNKIAKQADQMNPVRAASHLHPKTQPQATNTALENNHPNIKNKSINHQKRKDISQANHEYTPAFPCHHLYLARALSTIAHHNKHPSHHQGAPSIHPQKQKTKITTCTSHPQSRNIHIKYPKKLPHTPGSPGSRSSSASMRISHALSTTVAPRPSRAPRRTSSVPPGRSRRSPSCSVGASRGTRTTLAMGGRESI